VNEAGLAGPVIARFRVRKRGDKAEVGQFLREFGEVVEIEQVATGTRTVSINGTSIATVEASSVAQTVNFINGQATVTVLYKDAGQLSIGMKDDTVTQPVGGIRGGTGNFVSRPSTFVLSNIRRTDTGAANPGAANGAGLVFLPAGRPFSATVTALVCAVVAFVLRPHAPARAAACSRPPD